ncbi:MAG: hypothetical protein RL230_2407 [Pseudomonadota bacterium]
MADGNFGHISEADERQMLDAIQKWIEKKSRPCRDEAGA